MKCQATVAGVLWVCLASPLAVADEPPLRDQASKALRRAVEFFRKEVATEGGYLWRYSDDLKLREGEGKATATQVWVQPPGTPAVGLALLAAYEGTGENDYREAAREAAAALIKGQLRSGGWTYSIEFDPRLRKQFAYRSGEGNPKGRNVTTLDDNNTQEALRLLMRVDQALDFKDRDIHEAVEYALGSLLKAQYPIGAWPQGYNEFPDPEKYPVKKASFPDPWPRVSEFKEYWRHYTLNDNTLADMIDVMFLASRIYGEEKYRAAALKAGDFILLAQLPEPQPAWAQQYDANMHPAWARRFEPPAVTGGESQRIMRTLMQLYRATGEKKYLEPIPRALEYLKKSALPDGRLARFYELKTNKPLYFTKAYELTYQDDDLPTHYGFKVASSLDAIAANYEELKRLDPAELKKPGRPGRPQLSAGLIEQTKAVIARLDDRGRWVEDGRLRSDAAARRIISCQTFIHNVGVLSNYLAASKP
jgi:hypothetical protein